MFTDKHSTKNVAIKEIDQCKSPKSDENYKEINIHKDNINITEIGTHRKDADVKNEIILIKSEYTDCNSEDTDRSNENNIKHEELYIGCNKIDENVNIKIEELHNKEVFVYVTEVEIEQEATNYNSEQIKSEVLDISYEKESNSNIDSSDEETLIKYLGNIASDVSKDQYKCGKCDLITYSKNALRRHTYYSHSRGYLDCTYCSYKTRYTTSIQRHINAKHTQSNIFKCSLCNYETFTESNLNRHINGKHTKGISFNCPHCCYKTYYKSALAKHINYKHAKKVIFDCSVCKFQTYSRGTLAYHVNVKHNNEILNCLYCKYETCLKSNLNRHIKAKHPETR